jgi:hypothetical protein
MVSAIGLGRVAGLPFVALLLLGQSAFAAPVGSPPLLASGTETCHVDTYGYTDADGTAVTGLCVGGGSCSTNGDTDCNAGYCAGDGASDLCVCKTNAIGLNCSDCKEGYVMDTDANECVRCPGDVLNPCNEDGLDGYGNLLSAYTPSQYPVSGTYNTCS